MNIDAISSEKIQEKNTQAKAQNENEEKMSFSEEYQMLLAQNAMHIGMNALNDLNLIPTVNNQGSFLSGGVGIHSAFNYDTLTISKDDALFFSELVEKTDYVVKENGNSNSFQSSLLKVTNESDTQNVKSTGVSKVLMNLIEEAYKTQKPVRIDFDNNVSVILRIGRDGKVNAEFIPGDKAVEEYLRNNIGYLKDRLENQNLDYGDIMYKPYKNNSKKERNNQNGGKQNE